MRMYSLLLLYLSLSLVSSLHISPCSSFGSNLSSEIQCLRNLLNECSSNRFNRETRSTTPYPVHSSSSYSILRPSTPPTTSSTTTTTSTSTTTTRQPSTTLPITENPFDNSETSWPTPNSAYMVEALRYELTREIEDKIREANVKFEAKMSAYQVQMEFEMRKLNKELRLIKQKVHRHELYEYLIPEERESWYTASEICAEWGGNLASIKNEEENKFISGLIGSNESIWIGLNDIQREDQFVNCDGVQTTYRKWSNGQPDNLYHNENCVEIEGKDGEWKDSLCLLTKRFVCKRQ